MLPHLGAGAGQGLEDALILVKLLSHPKTTSASLEAGLTTSSHICYCDSLNSTIQGVLKVYDLVRRPRANSVWSASKKAGEIYEGYGPSGSSLEAMRKDLVGIWDAVWHHDLGADYERAVTLLQESGAF
jgi:salicylate hydroxylase